MPFVKESFYLEESLPGFVFLMSQFGLRQGEAQRVIDRGRLLVNHQPMTDKAARIEGEVQVVHFKPEPRGNAPLFVSQNFLVFDKPSGTLVHPNKTQAPYTLLDEIRAHSGPQANAVHRIDEETSGLVLASRNKKAETYLKNAFEHKQIRKSYLAWVDGEIREDFEVIAPIRINPDYSQTKHKVFIDFERGKPSHTRFKALEYDPDLDATLLKCCPLTGRTHQIRVHLFHVKHPILGDPIYGTTFDVTSDYLEKRLSADERIRNTGASRLMLHAQTLAFHYDHDYFIESRFGFERLKGEIIRERVKKNFAYA